MAKLLVVPALSIIDGFKGKIDFYVHRGQPCARMWPRSPGKRRAPAVEAQWQPFAYAAHLWSELDPSVKDAYADMVKGTDFTARDMFTRSFISGIKNLE